MSLRRMALATLALLVAFAGCGLSTDDAPRELSAEAVPFDLLAPRASTTTTSTTTPPIVSTDIEIYLAGTEGTLASVVRSIPGQPTVRDAIEALLRGAEPDEAARGLRSVITAETRLLGVQRREGTVVIDFTKEFTTPQGAEGVTAFAQVVFTATQFPDVTGVVFALDGQEIEAPKGDGTLTRGPLTRFSYPNRRPAEPAPTTTTSESA